MPRQAQSPAAVTTHVLGYPEGAGYGEYIVDLVHPGDQPIIQDSSNRVRDVRGSPSVRSAVATSGRVVMNAEILANNLLDDPSVMGVVVTIRDITERKLAKEQRCRASERRREGEAHYRGRWRRPDRARMPIFPDTTLTFVHRAFAGFFGRTPRSGSAPG